MATTVLKPPWKLKGCPKCKGDMLREDNSYECLQCGYIDWDSTNQPLLKVAKDNGGQDNG